MPRNNLQRNADYWAQRMKNMEDALLDQSYSYVENLDAQFRAAEAEIERQMSAWYRRFAANNDITLADAKRLLNSDELAEFHWTVEEYIKHGEENALTGAWMKISIHPPRAGRDSRAGASLVDAGKFQSTRPVRGGTSKQEINHPLGIISIHPPRAGRDSCCADSQYIYV